MEIKPVRTSKDHKAALGEVERLWDAKPGTEEHDRLEVLVTLIEAYEVKHHPIPPLPVYGALGIFSSDSYRSTAGGSPHRG